MKAFDKFGTNDSLASENTSLQLLYEYEKHYLELLKKHSPEIDFIDRKLKEFRQEQIDFFSKILPNVSAKLDAEAIDQEMKKVFMNRFANNIERSFALTETLLNDYSIKKLDEFKRLVQNTLKSIV
ncbi:hypothetical protein [Candidatus Epulonipiscium viviparus]|uniref:hypothetical protein n=1 Tax=Candidatus Epulonipiscium viviparus TaxID=420336 RepID=UPI0027380D3A|nr:hypothetical protein [Candidatus Epulopiscium viviparus]